jgi:hypothetical protein
MHAAPLHPLAGDLPRPGAAVPPLGADLPHTPTVVPILAQPGRPPTRTAFHPGAARAGFVDDDGQVVVGATGHGGYVPTRGNTLSVPYASGVSAPAFVRTNS